MRKFILASLVFLSPILLGLIVMEFALRRIPNEYKLKNEYINNHADQIETLILGNSHTYYGLNPTFFSGNCFNAANVSQSLDYDWEILKKLNGKTDQLKYVILPISYFSLFGKLETGVESWRAENYVKYCDIGYSTSPYSRFEVLSSLFRTNIKRIVRYYVLRDDVVACSTLGWGTSYSSDKKHDLIKAGMESAVRHTSSESKYFDDNREVLAQILEWCHERNIRVVLVTLPAYTTYRSHLDSQQLNVSVEFAEELALTHTNCEYLNLLDDRHFIADDFYDADHLNEKGAKKLSVMLETFLSGIEN